MADEFKTDFETCKAESGWCFPGSTGKQQAPAEAAIIGNRGTGVDAYTENGGRPADPAYEYALLCSVQQVNANGVLASAYFKIMRRPIVRAAAQKTNNIKTAGGKMLHVPRGTKGATGGTGQTSPVAPGADWPKPTDSTSAFKGYARSPNGVTGATGK
jgi:hypothetical protein